VIYLVPVVLCLLTVETSRFNSVKTKVSSLEVGVASRGRLLTVRGYGIMIYDDNKEQGEIIVLR